MIQPSPMLVHRDYLEVFLQLAAINPGAGGESDAAGSSEPVFPQCFPHTEAPESEQSHFPFFSPLECTHWVFNQTAPFLVSYLDWNHMRGPGFLLVKFSGKNWGGFLSIYYW